MDGVMLWKMPQFDLMEDKVDEIMGRVKKHKALILDLRGNTGGYEITWKRLASHLFDTELKVDLKRRKETKPVVIKPAGNPFKGQLIILVDSRSGSSSEIIARLVQLQKRGTIIGDRSSGKVMRSRVHPFEMGAGSVINYGVSITDADVIMPDGKSLEGVGVTPDEMALPSAEDMATKRDPVLARAVALVGLNLTPEKAGTLFPVEWQK
jgi:carboxyl-terminal processing protease